MKKPKITFIPYECFRVISADGYWLDDMQKMEAYEEMIDALIDVFEWMNCLDKGTHSIKEIQKWVEEGRNPHIKIEQALKKAGVEL